MISSRISVRLGRHLRFAEIDLSSAELLCRGAYSCPYDKRDHQTNNWANYQRWLHSRVAGGQQEAAIRETQPCRCPPPMRPVSAARSIVTEGASKRHKERRLMNVPPAQICAVVADVDSYKEFVPWCHRSRIIQRIDDSTFDADLLVGFEMFSERYTSRVTVQAPNLITSEAVDSEVFNHLKFRWEFAPGPTPTTTWATFAVDYSFKNALYGQTSVMFFDQVVAKMISAFAKRCRDLKAAK